MNKFEKGIPMGRPRDEIRAFVVEALAGQKPTAEIIIGIQEGFGIKKEDLIVEGKRIRIRETALGQLDKRGI